MNSVLHRDYGVSDNVLISVYRNRIEFRSPGRPAMSPSQTYATPVSPEIQKLVHWPNTQMLPTRLGEGINTVYERMRKAGFADPILCEDGVNLYVTLKRAPKDDLSSVIAKFVDKYGYVTNS